MIDFFKNTPCLYFLESNLLKELIQRSYFTIGMFKLRTFVCITNFYQFIRSLGLSAQFLHPSLLWNWKWICLNYWAFNLPHFVSCLRSLFIFRQLHMLAWWEPPQSSKQPWAASLPFPARVSAASCPHSVTASPSPHLVIKPRLYTVGVQVSICLHNHCQQLSIINCQGCFKAMWSSFSWHGDQVFLYLKKKKTSALADRGTSHLSCI